MNSTVDPGINLVPVLRIARTRFTLPIRDRSLSGIREKLVTAGHVAARRKVTHRAEHRSRRNLELFVPAVVDAGRFSMLSLEVGQHPAIALAPPLGRITPYPFL